MRTLCWTLSLAWKSVPVFVKEGQIITFLGEKISFLNDIFGGGIQTLLVRVHVLAVPCTLISLLSRPQSHGHLGLPGTFPVVVTMETVA